MSEQKRKGLGVAPFCLPESSLADPVTHAEFNEELQRLRSAVTLLANIVGPNIIGSTDAKRLLELLAPPWDRV